MSYAGRGGGIDVKGDLRSALLHGAKSVVKADESISVGGSIETDAVTSTRRDITVRSIVAEAGVRAYGSIPRGRYGRVRCVLLMG